MSEYIDALLNIANQWVGIRETSPNRGPEIDVVHEFMGRDPAMCDPYCAQWVSYMLHLASQETGIVCPLRKSSGALEFMRKNIAYHQEDPQPGDIFVIDHGEGKGHVGLVEAVDLNVLHTLEANTNPTGGRDGDGIYARIRDKSAINMGYIRPAV